jgi:transcriptional regulator with XRE-family HTH domain
MRFGLKGAILKRGLSQRQLSRLSDVPESRLSALVNGWANPSPAERQKLASVLKQDANTLFDADSTIEIRSAR